MTNYSGTYAGTIAALVFNIFTIFNADLPFTQDELEKAIAIVIALAIAAYTLYRRFKAGGVTKLGFYK